MATERLRRLAPSTGKVKLGLFRSWQLVLNGVKRLGDHRATQLAAAMAYYGLLSVFPGAIVAVGIAGVFLDQEAQSSIVDYLLRELPLSASTGRDEVESLIDGVVRNSGTIGLAGAFGLVFTSSALMGATRNSLSVAFEDPFRRGVVRGKAVDVLVVLGMGTVFVLSFAATLVVQLDLELGGAIGEAINAVLGVTGQLLPLAMVAAAFAVMLHILPVTRPPVRNIWPGVAFAAIGYELLKSGFSFYLDQFANYNAVYGSLGAVIAFLFFIYLASLLFLLGAEIAALWPSVRAGEYDPGMGDDDEPFSQQAREFVVGLFSRGGPDPDELQEPASRREADG